MLACGMCGGIIRYSCSWVENLMIPCSGPLHVVNPGQVSISHVVRVKQVRRSWLIHIRPIGYVSIQWNVGKIMIRPACKNHADGLEQLHFTFVLMHAPPASLIGGWKSLGIFFPQLGDFIHQKLVKILRISIVLGEQACVLDWNL